MSPRVSHNRVVETAGERWIGDFVLQEELGRGGMGVVYKALRPSDGALAAIKILPLAMSLDDARLRRFEREGRLAQQVRHPNLVCVEESGRLADGTLYLRMELLRGPTLRDALAEAGGRLNPQDALTACLQIARGLAAMHAAGIVHRDVKPSNVMWADSQRNEAKLLDFGIARELDGQEDLTAERATIGTARYMSPEQCIGTARLTGATDVYSLGVVLFESVTGVHPLVQGNDSREELLELHRLGAPKRLEQIWPEAPAGLILLLDALLNRDPVRRPTAHDVIEKLSALIPIVPSGPLPIAAASDVTGADQTADPQAPDLGAYVEAVKESGPPRKIRKPHTTLSTILGGVGVILVLLGATEGMLRWTTGKGTSGLMDWMRRGSKRTGRIPMMAPNKPRPPAGMVEIDGGQYLQGSTQERIDAERSACLSAETESACTSTMFDRELGPREVIISPFFIDRTEVTNDAFVAWLNSGRRSIDFEEGHILRVGGRQIASTHGVRTGIAKEGGRYVVKPGMGQLPVVNVSWAGAFYFCADQGKSLPTEAEFEYIASRHGTARYPWGNQDPTCQDAIALGHEQFMRCEGNAFPPVGSMQLDVTPEGVSDLGGSVREWQLDRFVQRYKTCSGPCQDPVVSAEPIQSDAAGTRVVRGGAFETSKVTARASFRSRANEDNVYESIGFRCVVRT